jgi:hypothetical protein
MSWDILLMRVPSNIASVQELPDHVRVSLEAKEEKVQQDVKLTIPTKRKWWRFWY